MRSFMVLLAVVVAAPAAGAQGTAPRLSLELFDDGSVVEEPWNGRVYRLDAVYECGADLPTDDVIFFQQWVVGMEETMRFDMSFDPPELHPVDDVSQCVEPVRRSVNVTVVPKRPYDMGVPVGFRLNGRLVWEREQDWVKEFASGEMQLGYWAAPRLSSRGIPVTDGQPQVLDFTGVLNADTEIWVSVSGRDALTELPENKTRWAKGSFQSDRLTFSVAPTQTCVDETIVRFDYSWDIAGRSGPPRYNDTEEFVYQCLGPGTPESDEQLHGRSLGDATVPLLFLGAAGAIRRRRNRC